MELDKWLREQNIYDKQYTTLHHFLCISLDEQWSITSRCMYTPIM